MSGVATLVPAPPEPADAYRCVESITVTRCSDVVDAAVALLPELESLLGVPSASVASARVGVPAAYVMTPEMARAVLATLPKA